MHRASSTAVPTNFSTIQLEARMLQAQVSGMIHHRLNGAADANRAADHHHQSRPRPPLILPEEPRTDRMPTAQPKPILNTPLPSQFGQIAWSSRMITGEVLNEPR
jgi:hypothetical protein